MSGVQQNSGSRLITADGILDGTGFHPGEALFVESGCIADRGPAVELSARHPDAPLDRFEGCALLPGTINAHSHSFQVALRGLTADKSFAEWRRELYRVTPTLLVEEIYALALHSFAEMLLAGITTVVDFFYLHHRSNAGSLAVVQAARDLGVRLVLARCMYDAPDAPAAFRESVPLAVANARDLAKRLQGDDLVTVIPAPHSPHGASPEMIAAGARLALDWVSPWHMHVAEAASEGSHTRARYGRTPVAWLSSSGLLDERLAIVHGVWVDEPEIRLLAAARSSLIHCPGANLFLGDGICPTSRYRDAGVSIALGSDSASANEQLSIFGEMRLAALLQKGNARSREAGRVEDAFAMGTLAGATVAGLPVGQLVPGRRADIVVVDLSDPSLRPAHDLLSNVVHSMHQRAVVHVIVNGAAVVRDRTLSRLAMSRIAAGLDSTIARHFPRGSDGPRE